MMRWVLLAVCLAGAGCDGPQATTVQTNTNWLERCEMDEECGGSLACHCGICTLDCGSDVDCETLPDSRCALSGDPSNLAACESREPSLASGICLPECEPGTCRNDEACVSGACVSIPLPDSEFCAPVAERNDVDRASEDELLALLQAVRVDSGAVCGSEAPSSAVPALRLDARLRCAARVLTVEMEATGTLGLVDSLGRDTQDRLTLVDYTTVPWGESYAIAATAAEALASMMSDVDSCQRFTDATFLDVGVGASGEAHVVTIGAE